MVKFFKVRGFLLSMILFMLVLISSCVVPNHDKVVDIDGGFDNITNLKFSLSEISADQNIDSDLDVSIDTTIDNKFISTQVQFEYPTSHITGIDFVAYKRCQLNFKLYDKQKILIGDQLFSIAGGANYRITLDQESLDNGLFYYQIVVNHMLIEQDKMLIIK